jgi:hypothetical protein
MDWAKHLKPFEDLGDSDDRKWGLADQFLNAVGAQFLQGHQIVQKRTDNEAELRGTWNGFPARLKLDMSFGELEWEMKASNPPGVTMYFHWDLDAVPAVGQFNGKLASDWDDDGGETKIFFAKGFYLDGDNDELDRQMATYQALPPQVRSALATYMVGDRIPRFYVYGHGSLLLAVGANLHELSDPLNATGRAIWLAGQMAWGLSQINVAGLPPAAQPAPQGLLYKMTCGYCQTMYLWSQSNVCPNCGAAPRG